MENPTVTEKYFVEGEEILACDWEQAARKVLEWNSIHIETREICNNCGEEYFKGHKCI